MLQEYKNIKNSILATIKEVSAYFADNNNKRVTSHLNMLQSKLQDNIFNLVVLGQFKRGKSTFINALLGDSILPSAVIPLTSIVTILKYGEKEDVKVYYENGNIEHISREDLPMYVTEKGNPQNKRGVERVEIQYPAQYLKDGLCLIDTPGVGSTYKNNTEVTYSFLPKVDAAIFLLSVDPPISQSEIDFLDDIRQYVSKIFFVQNKIDYLDENEINDIVNFSKASLVSSVGDVRIYPLSAKLALEAKKTFNNELLEKSRFETFEKELERFLLSGKVKILFESVLKSLKKLLIDEKSMLNLQLKSLDTPLEELEERIVIFNLRMKEISQQREDLHYYFEGEIRRVMDRLDRDLEAIKEKGEMDIESSIKQKFEEVKDRSMSELILQMETHFENEIIKTLNQFVIREEEVLNNEYAKVVTRYAERANEVINTLLAISSEIFDVQLKTIDLSTTIVQDSSLYYLTGNPPKFFNLGGAFDYFSKKLLPKGISRSLFLKSLLKQIPQKLDQNCGRIRSDYMDRIQRSFLNFKWDLNSSIDQLQRSIENAVKRAIGEKSLGEKQVALTREQINMEIEKLNRLLENVEHQYQVVAGNQHD